MIKKLLSTRRVAVTLALVFAIAMPIMSCVLPETSWVHEQAMAMEITTECFSTRERFSMLVLYIRDGEYFVLAARGDHDFEVEDNKLYMDDEVIVNDTLVVGWGLYPEQTIEIPLEWDEESQDYIEVAVTLTELNLREFEADDLPQSGHYAKLSAVYPDDVLKAEVSRPFYGKWYEGIRCLVTLSVYQAYLAGDIAIGDYVWVYYSNDPRPGHEHKDIPIVIDKVITE